MFDKPIGIFDSGIGGLNVLRECVLRMPHEKFVYLADSKNMPYGNKSDDEIVSCALDCADILFGMNCKAVVIACNTATALAVTRVRAVYPNSPIIGLEPAVKPCVKQLGRRGYAVALVTDATFRSEKFKRLTAQYGESRIVPVDCSGLAALIERNVCDIEKTAPHVRGLLSPYPDAEAVVLGCSHYAFVVHIIKEFYGGNIKIYDGAAGAAERLEYCLKLGGLCASDSEKGGVRFYSTV